MLSPLPPPHSLPPRTHVVAKAARICNLPLAERGRSLKTEALNALPSPPPPPPGPRTHVVAKAARRAHVRPQRAGDEEVGAAALDGAVGRDDADGDRRQAWEGGEGMRGRRGEPTPSISPATTKATPLKDPRYPPGAHGPSC